MNPVTSIDIDFSEATKILETIRCLPKEDQLKLIYLIKGAVLISKPIASK